MKKCCPQPLVHSSACDLCFMSNPKILNFVLHKFLETYLMNRGSQNKSSYFDRWSKCGQILHNDGQRVGAFDGGRDFVKEKYFVTYGTLISAKIMICKLDICKN